MSLSVLNIGLLVTVVTLCGREAAGVDWHYSDAAHWRDTFSKCGGQQQSPININTNLVEAEDDLGQIQFYNYNVVPAKQTVTNDGHTIKVDISTTSSKPYITLDLEYHRSYHQTRKYNFAQYHFHWGSVSSQGSEHTIDSARFPMELHLVHFNDIYPNISTAVTRPDGLAVLGIFFAISKTDNPSLTPLISAIQEVKDYTKGPYYVGKSNLRPLASLLPSNTLRFYRYDGSLTTPTCDQSVLWTVFEAPLQISEAQMAVFRSVVGSNGLSSNNYRPIQPLNGREVEQSWT